MSEKSANGKIAKIILIICCVIFTAAFVFDVVKFHNHREYVERKLYEIESKLDHLEVRIGGVNRENGELFEKLNEIESSLSLITKRLGR